MNGCRKVMPADAKVYSSGLASAFGEELDQGFLVRAIEEQSSVFHATFVATFTNVVEECVDLLEVLLADHDGLRNQVVGPFQVNEPDGSVEGEIELDGIQ